MMRTPFKSLLAGAVASVAVMACAGGANAFSVTFDELGNCIGCVSPRGTPITTGGVVTGGVSYTLPSAVTPSTHVTAPGDGPGLDPSDIVTVSGTTLNYYSDPLFTEQGP